MITTLIFDLDGTLLDTLADLTDSVNEAMRVQGFPQHTITQIRGYVGNGVRNLMERATPQGADNPRFDDAFACFKAHYAQHCQDKTAPYPGIMDLLHELGQQHYRMAIVSNKYDTAVKALNTTFFASYISVAIGESATVRRKPAPDTVWAALRALQSTPEEAVYIGDSEVDLQTARNAGLPCISVTWGFRERAFLMQQGATRIIDTPQELAALLKTI